MRDIDITFTDIKSECESCGKAFPRESLSPSRCIGIDLVTKIVVKVSADYYLISCFVLALDLSREHTYLVLADLRAAAVCGHMSIDDNELMTVLYRDP